MRMRTDLGRFPKSRDVIVFLPSTRIQAAIVALFAVSAVIVLTVDEMREQANQFEIQERV